MSIAANTSDELIEALAFLAKGALDASQNFNGTLANSLDVIKGLTDSGKLTATEMLIKASQAAQSALSLYMLTNELYLRDLPTIQKTAASIDGVINSPVGVHVYCAHAARVDLSPAL